MFIKRLKGMTIKAMTCCLSLTSLLTLPAMASDDVHKDWIVDVKTEEIKRQFDYRGSTLKTVAKLTVEFFHETDKDNVKPYQKIYYHDGKPIGMERTGDLNLPPTETVVIKVTPKRGTADSEENKGAADILWRLALSLSHNRSPLISTILPDASFNEISRELLRIGFSDSAAGPEKANKAKAMLALESETSGESKKVYFY
ncbi:MAG: hypothetical protein K2W95_29040 [Candidatus Obscuribacterales bacterium]|nr:hypothetical protein [Candidatus Obscuribacterales bacterium]